MKQLTSLQKGELIESYVELIIDSMDEKDLVRYVSQDMTDFLEKLTNNELEEEISLTMDGETYDELVDNVINETVLDTNNNGGKF
tara:strand:- start:63 stop:317 length:255 start_codon:yes stop_codon:yes gene_type:complete